MTIGNIDQLNLDVKYDLRVSALLPMACGKILSDKQLRTLWRGVKVVMSASLAHAHF